jgi:hypothetical protein
MDGKASRGDFLIGGRQKLDEDGRYVGGMSMAEMIAYKKGIPCGNLTAFVTTEEVAVQPTPDATSTAHPSVE